MLLRLVQLKKLRLYDIKEVSKNRAPGYEEAVLSKGKIDGEFLYLHVKDFAELRATYPPIKPEGRPCCKGLGDLVAIPAQAIARSIDRVVGTNIQNCEKCKKRQAFLNKVIPF